MNQQPPPTSSPYYEMDNHQQRAQSSTGNRAEPEKKDDCGCCCCLETFFCGTIPWWDVISFGIVVIGAILLGRASEGLDTPEIQLLLKNLYEAFHLKGPTAEATQSVVSIIHGVIFIALAIDSVSLIMAILSSRACRKGCCSDDGCTDGCMRLVGTSAHIICFVVTYASWAVTLVLTVAGVALLTLELEIAAACGPLKKYTNQASGEVSSQLQTIQSGLLLLLPDSALISGDIQQFQTQVNNNCSYEKTMSSPTTDLLAGCVFVLIAQTNFLIYRGILIVRVNNAQNSNKQQQQHYELTQ